VLERSVKEERSSKRCDIRRKVSREDTIGSGSRDEDHEVRPLVTLEGPLVQNG
jgi:hypothetical protein